MTALANLTQIDPQNLENLEKGQRLPTKDEIRHISQALHLRADSLIALTLDGWVPQPQPGWTTEDDLVETIQGRYWGL